MWHSLHLLVTVLPSSHGLTRALGLKSHWGMVEPSLSCRSKFCSGFPASSKPNGSASFNQKVQDTQCDCKWLVVQQLAAVENLPPNIQQVVRLVMVNDAHGFLSSVGSLM